MKQLIGTILSTKVAKTAKVSVIRIKVHPLYKKRIKFKKSYQVHNDLGAKVGQKVKFQSCRPFSKTKKWQIVEIINSEKDKKNKTIFSNLISLLSDEEGNEVKFSIDPKTQLPILPRELFDAVITQQPTNNKPAVEDGNAPAEEEQPDEEVSVTIPDVIVVEKKRSRKHEQDTPEVEAPTQKKTKTEAVPKPQQPILPASPVRKVPLPPAPVSAPRPTGSLPARDGHGVARRHGRHRERPDHRGQWRARCRHGHHRSGHVHSGFEQHPASGYYNGIRQVTGCLLFCASFQRTRCRKI
jgi:small subunit ribosomal protein S17